MDNLRNSLAVKLRKVYKLEFENQLAEVETRELLDTIAVKEAELQSIQARINGSLAKRGTLITDALGAYNQRLTKSKENVASIAVSVKKYRDNALSTIEDSIDLYGEICEKENKLFQTIGHIMEVKPETYEPDEDWLKDVNEFKKKAKEMTQSDKKFMEQRKMVTKKMIDDLSRVSLPRAESISSQSTLDLDESDLTTLHNFIPEE